MQNRNNRKKRRIISNHLLLDTRFQIMAGLVASVKTTISKVGSLVTGARRLKIKLTSVANLDTFKFQGSMKLVQNH